ncbi:MAG: 16S rRNA (guanine(966)-N(2))-methyltransferase RsmD [Bacteroidetes bacterium]|nr:16S rRNA (guanine(966)-N(2))-methyltransferase RsmD [Bacteroidota bacterium]
MRIIAGKYKGHVIHAPKAIPARPTTDRSKESLFNILLNKMDLEGIRVLDLFSGTGNMAYEFASRGAKEVIAVDQNATAVRFISDTFKKLGVEGRVVRANAMSYHKKVQESFDLIFADPPYALKGIAELPQAVLESQALEVGGWFIMEHGTQLKPGNEYLTEQRVYGQSAFSFYQKTPTFDQILES